MNAWSCSQCSGAVLSLIIAILVSAPVASADLPPYEFNPDLSLTADPACQTSAVDPVADPGCPYPPPPDGPTERFNEPRAIAFDPYGNEYVATAGGPNGRVLVFDHEGVFITELVTSPLWRIAVDSKGNLYTFTTGGKVFRFEPAAGYDPETGDIAYTTPGVELYEGDSAVGALAVDRSNDHLFVTVPNMIREYGPAEEVIPGEANKLIDTYEPAELGAWTRSIAIDAQRARIYVGYCKSDIADCGILVLDAENPEIELHEPITGSTTPKGEFMAELAALGVAVDEESGDFFVQDFAVSPGAVYRFGEDYEYLSSLTDSRFATIIALQIAVSNGERPPGSGEDASNRHFLFIPTPAGGQLGNRALAYQPPGETAPVIEEVSAAGIGETQAQLQALIDPRGGETTYRFEITTQASFEAEGFEGAEVAGEGVIPATNLATQVSVPVDGLSPGGAYRFRVVAKNAIGDAGEEGQNEAAFTTYSDVPIQPGCANQALRFGPSARLPDCRAYELVTPPDTNGRRPRGVGVIGDIFTTLHASPAGNEVYFKIEGGSLPGTSGVASFEGDPYVATRGSEGWSTALTGPSGDQATDGLLGSPSPDMGYSFWTAINGGPLVLEKGLTHYLRYPDGQLELTGRGSIDTDPRAVGTLITEDATHVIFITRNVFPDKAIQLEPNAPPNGTEAVYDRTIDPVTGAEKTHVVSLLPGDATPGAGEHATYQGASKDGEGIAFSISNKLYLRVNNETTYEVGEEVEFAGVSEGGARIFYVEGGDLKALDTTTPSPEVIDFSSSGDITPVNVATGGARAYFVSPSVLGSTNPEGDSAQADEQNLYLSEEGQISFVATVTDRDVEGEPLPGPLDAPSDGLGLWTEALSDPVAKDPSRTTPDGSVLLFQSRAEITGYPESEFPQIYRYDSGEGRLHCISCIPTKTPASGGASLQTVSFNSETPPPLNSHALVPNITPDGKRVFFESTEALVSTDTDDVQDVYEWEEQGIGSCTRAGGCVYLISSGQSERDNFLYAHSQSGNDVFFTTGDVLNGFDGGGTPSIYDARVNGGFAEEEAVPCVDEGCLLPLVPPPALPSPRQQVSGEEVVPPKPKARHCPKGKRKVKKNGKVRCVKKHKRAKK